MAGEAVTGLWRDRDFVLFWGGQAVSLTGSSLTRVAMPLLALLTLHTGPIGLGVLEASVWLPFLGLPLLAGVYVDRHRKRPILLTTNALRAALLGLVPVLAATGGLSLTVLCAIALVAGCCEVFFQVAELAFVPALVGRDRLLPANSSIEAARSGAELAGPGIAGLIVQGFGAPVAMAVDAVTYLASMASLGAIRRPEPPPEPVPAGRIWRDIVDGLRFVWRSVPIRTAAVWGMLVNGAWQAFNVPFVLYAIQDRHIGAGWWGLILALSGGAALLGALLAPRLAGRYGYGPAMIGTSAALNLPMLLIPAAGGPLWTVRLAWLSAYAVSGLGAGVVNVLVITLRAKITPDRLLGRVAASARLLVFAAIPLGAVAGGVLAGTLGNRPSLWLTTVAILATVLTMLPLRRLRVLPEPTGLAGT
jgi:MFS family permease